jgi:hypothetical protein
MIQRWCARGVIHAPHAVLNTPLTGCSPPSRHQLSMREFCLVSVFRKRKVRIHPKPRMYAPRNTIYHHRSRVRSEVFTAVTMDDAVFWDIKTQFVLHRTHTTSPLQSSASQCYVRFEVFTAVTMKNVVFWDIKIQFLLHKRHTTPPL